MEVDTCPGCSKRLQPHSPEGVFACPSCGGYYIVRKALVALGAQAPRSIGRTTPRKPRRCAGCGAGMDTLKVKGITLDCCDDCGSLYFDAGELEAVRAARPGAARESACDGCGRRVPNAELHPRDDRNLCPGCLAGQSRPAPLSEVERGYQVALQHASAAQTAWVQGGEQHYGLADDLQSAANALGPNNGGSRYNRGGPVSVTVAVLEALVSIFS